MEMFEGFVSGIDVIAAPGKPLKCHAIIGNQTLEEKPVQTELHQLQTVLETACCAKSKVEVYYDESGSERTLLRVKIKDRDVPD